MKKRKIRIQEEGKQNEGEGKVSNNKIEKGGLDILGGDTSSHILNELYFTFNYKKEEENNILLEKIIETNSHNSLEALKLGLPYTSGQIDMLVKSVSTDYNASFRALELNIKYKYTDIQINILVKGVSSGSLSSLKALELSFPYTPDQIDMLVKGVSSNSSNSLEALELNFPYTEIQRKILLLGKGKR